MVPESLDRADPVRRSSDKIFGLVFAGVFLVVAVLPVLMGGAMRVWSLLLSAAFAIAAFLRPAFLAPLNRMWARFGLLLHGLTSPLVLAIMFFAVIAPMGLIMRVLRRDTLRLRLDRTAPTYWIDRVPPGPPADTLDNQF